MNLHPIRYDKSFINCNCTRLGMINQLFGISEQLKTKNMEEEMKKQTAVEWLEQKIEKLLPDFIIFWQEEFEHAKAMEREQHKTSFNKGYDRRNYIHDFEYGGVEYWEEEPKEFEQYYNETYGGDK